MKRYVAWVGAVAVVATLGFSGYAVADQPDLYGRNLTLSGGMDVAGPFAIESAGNGYNGPTGGPAGVGTIPEGAKCIHVALVPEYVDGYALNPDYNQAFALVTLQGVYAGVSVAGTNLYTRAQDDFTNRMQVCLTKRAPVGGVRFGYLIANISWSG